MALKNLFDMVKADRYTQDGRDELIKAQEAETEDARRTYQIGEISEATGLQKTAQGWKPPKETKFGKVKQNKEGQWGVQTKQGKGSDFLKHKSEKEASRALANYTAGYNTTERSKQDPHSDQARQVKHWDKETEKIRKQNRAEGRAAHAAQFQKPAAENKTTVRQGPNTKTLNETPAEHIKKNWDYYGGRSSQGDMEELVLGPSGYKETDSYSVMGGGKRVQYSKEGAENIVLFYDENGELDDYEIEAAPKAQESKPAAQKKSQSVKSVKEYLSNNFWSQPEDFKNEMSDAGWDVDEMTNEYAVISNEAGSQYEVRFADHGDGRDLTMKSFKALQIDEDDDSLEDAAPRVLTGDTRIRVRKA